MTRLRDAAALVALAGMPGAQAADVLASGTGIDLGAGPGLARITLNLLLVLAAIVAVAFFARRSGAMRSPGDGTLRVHASLALGPKERLLIVDADGERVLVGASSAGLTALHVLDAAGATSLADNGEPDARPTPTFRLPLPGHAS